MKKVVLLLTLSFALCPSWADDHEDRVKAAVKAHTNYVMSELSLWLNVCPSNGTCVTKAQEKKEKFKEDFGAASSDPKVRSTFAQWITAMNTASTRQGQAEAAKFSTLANELALE